MTSLEIIGLVVVGVVVVLLVLSALSKFVLHIMKGPLEARIAAHYGQDEILLKDLKANSFGVRFVVTSLGSDPVYGFRGLLGCCPTLD